MPHSFFSRNPRPRAPSVPPPQLDPVVPPQPISPGKNPVTWGGFEMLSHNPVFEKHGEEFEVMPGEEFVRTGGFEELPTPGSQRYKQMIARPPTFWQQVAGVAYNILQSACKGCKSGLVVIGSILVSKGIGALCGCTVEYLAPIMTRTLSSMCADAMCTRTAKIMCGLCVAALSALGSELVAIAGAGALCTICIGIFGYVAKEFICMAGKEALMAAGARALQYMTPAALANASSRLCAASAQLTAIWQRMPPMPGMPPGFRRS